MIVQCALEIVSYNSDEVCIRAHWHYQKRRSDKVFNLRGVDPITFKPSRLELFEFLLIWMNFFDKTPYFGVVQVDNVAYFRSFIESEIIPSIGDEDEIRRFFHLFNDHCA